MTIISSSIKQQQLIMEFYKQLFSKSMKRDALYNICLMLVNTIKNNAICSSYKSCADMLRDNNITADNKEYKLAFTALKKLGIILKHNNRYLLNPAVEANYTSRRYELIIGYYNLLFGETAFELLTLDELRQLAVSSYTADIDKRNQLIEENNYLYEKFGSPRFEYMQPIHIKSYDQLYQLAFNTAKPKSLSTYDKPIYKAINEAYRNVCTNQATKLFIEHIRILEEQGIVNVQWGGKGTKTNYTFHKFTLKAQKALVSYDQTHYYLDNLPIPDEELAAQFFEDTQQKLQLQFEEEDAANDAFTSSKDAASLQLDKAFTSTISINSINNSNSVQQLSCLLPQYASIPTSEEILEEQLDWWDDLSYEDKVIYFQDNPKLANKLHKELTGFILFAEQLADYSASFSKV